MSISERGSFLENEQTKAVLENLQLWLTTNGHTAETGIFAKRSIQSFLYHYFAMRPPYLMYLHELIFTAEGDDNRHVWLHFLTTQPFDSLEQSIVVNDLNIAFTHGVAIPLLPDLSVHTEFFTPENLEGKSFYELIQEIAKEDSYQYLGTITFKQE